MLLIEMFLVIQKLILKKTDRREEWGTSQISLKIKESKLI